MNYPYDIRWTGSHGSYRERATLELACPLLFIYGRRKPFMFHSPEWAAGVASPARLQGDRAGFRALGDARTSPP